MSALIVFIESEIENAANHLVKAYDELVFDKTHENLYSSSYINPIYLWIKESTLNLLSVEEICHTVHEKLAFHHDSDIPFDYQALPHIYSFIVEKTSIAGEILKTLPFRFLCRLKTMINYCVSLRTTGS